MSFNKESFVAGYTLQTTTLAGILVECHAELSANAKKACEQQGSVVADYIASFLNKQTDTVFSDSESFILGIDFANNTFGCYESEFSKFLSNMADNTIRMEENMFLDTCEGRIELIFHPQHVDKWMKDEINLLSQNLVRIKY